MTTTHTPGPWHRDASTAIYARDYGPICSMAGFTPEDGANARLIAEAPALVKSLRDVVHTLWRIADPADRAAQDAIREADAILARIKGE